MTDSPEERARTSPTDLASLWLGRVEHSLKAAEKWRKRGQKITRIYRCLSSDQGGGGENSAKFNIFWSNVETLGPATYSRRPRVEAYRRFHDSDPTARLAGMILERGLQYELDCKNDFHLTLKGCVKDRLLPGLAAAWVRYEPTFGKETKLLPNPADPQAEPIPQEVETVTDEFTAVDYVFWEDFIVSPARTWTDVRWVARLVLFSREALDARFAKTMKKLGGNVKDVACDLDPAEPDTGRDTGGRDSEERKDDTTKRAGVYEIWDKEGKQCIWVAKGAQVPLDVRDDVSKLEDFFPCPPPLLATTTNDEILPIPDYVYYQEQIRELDLVTRRIGLLVGALRLIGVYDSQQTVLGTLLSGGMENKMVPVNAWAALAEKGGMKGVMDFLPLEQVAKILDGLYTAREQLKQSVYEITGMADIVRGVSKASETLGTQQIKAKFANLRLSSRQQQVAEFVTGILRVKAELICEHYQPATLARISSCSQLQEVIDDLAKVAQQKAMQEGQAAAQQAQAMGVPPPPPPQPQPITDPMQSPLVQKAIQLLKDEKARKYRIEVAADSMIELDEVGEQERRDTFMSTVSNFFNAMKNVTSVGPEMVPVALEMLKFVVRGFSAGRALESTIEDAVEKIKQKMANPPQQPPPETVQVAQIRADADKETTKMEVASREKIAGAEQNFANMEAAASQRHEAQMANFDRLREDEKMAREQARQDQEQAFSTQMQAREQAEAERQRQLDSQLATRDQEAKQGQESAVTDLKQGQELIVKGLEELMKASQRLRKRKAVYDKKGDIVESVEEFID